MDSIPCCLGFHSGTWDPPYLQTRQYVDKNDNPTYSEKYTVQKRTCTSCGRVTIKKV